MTRGATGRRAAGAAVLATLAIAAGVAWPERAAPPDPRPNVIVVLTDDQPADSLDAMPWLRARLDAAGSGWTAVPVAIANTPLCCPSRASLLTGRYARHTGVLDNGDGSKFDETDTLATRLHGAGYHTGLVGKYLNRYPFGRLPYVPPGWDRFVAKGTTGDRSVYRDFPAVVQGSPVSVRRYATDWLAEHAVRFVRAAPTARPFFLVFAPSAPHTPWEAAARHAAADVAPRPEPPNVAGALRGAPAWVRSLPAPSAAQRAAWRVDRSRADRTLLAVDEALRAIVAALGDRGDETVIFVLADNGYSFGEHRWVGKTCPYEACVRIPMAVLSPWAGPRPPPLVSIVDLAPTVLRLAGVAPPGDQDGVPFAGWVAPGIGGGIEPRGGRVFLEWVGDDRIPAWIAVRTADLKLIRYGDGSEELYDLGGAIGPGDPWELDNRARDPRYATVLLRLRAQLERALPGRIGTPG
ncbi:MAG TPA: sulfatase-like hydrolase/transferase [Actinomycetota bacterium]|nr:sulfatase-like hydrolase/transferase [Actinomycetota bacterium]